MKSSSRTYAVIGTSEGALALALELRIAGHEVIVSDIPARHDALDALRASPDFEVDSRVTDFVGGVRRTAVTGLQVTAELADAAAQAEVIILMTPQTSYEDVVSAFQGSRRAGQIILLSPGGLGGSLLVSQLAAKAGASDILVAQTASMPISGRRIGANELRIVAKKRLLPVGVFPARRSEELLFRLRDDFPQLIAMGNALECGLASAAPGLHPIPMIMNAARIESDGPYVYDAYEITPAIARVIEAVDEERQAIVRAIGAEPTTIAELLHESYGVDGTTFFEVVRNVPAYRQVKSPPDLGYRYLSDDVPTQVVPAVSLARALGVKTPMLEATVAFANAMHGRDYWKAGWNLEKLGLSGLSADAIRMFLANGHP